MSESVDESLFVRSHATEGMASVMPLDSRRARRARNLAAEVELELDYATPAPEAVAVRQKYFGVVFSDEASESEQYPPRM